MLSRNNICYDLRKSHFRCTRDGVTYVFSSRLHLNKFKERADAHRETINQSLSNRFNFAVNVNTLADVVLYNKIETRGFLIVAEGEQIECQSKLLLNGVTATMKS